MWREHPKESPSPANHPSLEVKAVKSKAYHCLQFTSYTIIVMVAAEWILQPEKRRGDYASSRSFHTKVKCSPYQCGQLAGHGPVLGKVTIFIPSQGTRLKCGFDPQSVKELLFLTLIFLSISFSIPSLLSENKLIKS